MRVVFMGTAGFACPSLRAIHQSERHQVVSVFCQPPRPAKRGLALQRCEVNKAADELGIKALYSSDFECPKVLSELEAADVGVTAAYGVILPEIALETPKRGFINVHPSLLPHWRGAAPIQRAIMAGEKETGVTIMEMTKKVDSGPMISQKKVAIDEHDTALSLTGRLSKLGAEMVVDVLDRMSLESIESVPQPEEGLPYAGKIMKSEARIDWSESASALDLLIRAMSPHPGAWCEVNGERLKILRAELADGSGQPGEFLQNGRVACGEGALELMEVQRAGKKPLSAKEWLKGVWFDDRTVFT